MNDPELIPCDDELERLKIFLLTFSRLKKNAVPRRLFEDKYYKDPPPFTIASGAW